MTRKIKLQEVHMVRKSQTVPTWKEERVKRQENISVKVLYNNLGTDVAYQML